MLLVALLAMCLGGCDRQTRYPLSADRDQQGQPNRTERAHAKSQTVVVTYLPDYAISGIDPAGIDLQPITDIIYFGLDVTGDDPGAVVKIDPQHLAILKQLKERSGCRLLLCAGGWGRSDGFASITSKPAKRQAFISALFNFCQAHDFDGVDYDWEHPQNDQQKSDYATLVAETSEVFQEQSLLVTVALAPWQNLGPVFYDSVDRIHLMSYDQDYPHATMDHARADVERLLGWGSPPEKIAIGIPFYGRNQQRQAKSYRQLIEQGADTSLPDVIDGFAYNGPLTVEAKTRWAIKQGLAGVMVWELTQDSEDQSLLQAIKRGARTVNDPASVID